VIYYINEDGKTVKEIDSVNDAVGLDPDRLFTHDPNENPFMTRTVDGRFVYTSVVDGRKTYY